MSSCRASRAGGAKCSAATIKPLLCEQNCESYTGISASAGGAQLAELLTGPETIYSGMANERYQRNQSNQIKGVQKETTRERPRKKQSETNVRNEIYNVGCCGALRADEAECSAATSVPLLWEQHCESYTGIFASAEGAQLAEFLTGPDETIHYGRAKQKYEERRSRTKREYKKRSQDIALWSQV